MDKTQIADSARLAYLLRHSSLPDDEGYVSVELLFEKHGFSREYLHKIVSEDPKGRYEYSADDTKIRAVYGHSKQVNIQREKVVPPPLLYHGTATKSLPQILKEGIKPRSRQYVHLSTSIATARSVDARHGSPVVLAVKAQEVQKNGGNFHRVTDEVWLTFDIDATYISLVNE